MAQKQLSASTSPFDLNWPDPECRAELDWLMAGSLETVGRVLGCWETSSPHLDPGPQEMEPGLSCLRRSSFVHTRDRRLVRDLR